MNSYGQTFPTIGRQPSLNDECLEKGMGVWLPNQKGSGCSPMVLDLYEVRQTSLPLLNPSLQTADYAMRLAFPTVRTPPPYPVLFGRTKALLEPTGQKSRRPSQYNFPFSSLV